MTLWDLLAPEKLRAWFGGAAPERPRARAKPRSRLRVKLASAGAIRAQSSQSASASERYDAMTRELLALHKIKVRKWRTSMSGVAWQVRYRDGSAANLIEAPRPKGPMSAAVFLHEVGHHAIGLNVYKPRCLEEYQAWAWAIGAMERHGIAVTDNVRYRMHQSLAYAVAKAQRRGIKEIPPELGGYLTFLPRRRKAG